MNKLKYFLFFVVLYVLFSGSIIFYYSTPTKGDLIEEYSNSRKALLIVDLQKDCVGESVKKEDRYSNELEIIKNNNKLIEHFIGNNMSVIFIRQEFDGFIGSLFSKVFVKGKLIKGSEGTKISESLNKENGIYFSKPKGDAFSNKKLNEFLIENKIDELLITGIDGEYCVLHTSIGAINRGYKVSVVKDAIGFKNADKIEKVYDRYKKLGVLLIESSGLN